jgi:hypothetical protein
MDLRQDPRQALEALDQKAFRIHTRADATAVYEKLLRDPRAITEDDLVVIRFFHGDQEADKYAALRAKAIAGPTPADPAPPTRKAPSLRKYFDAYTEGLVKAWAPIFKSYKAEIESLKAEIENLKARPSLKFCGTWEAGETYAPGDVVQVRGGLWICERDTPGEPSKDFIGWRLAVKSRSVQP